jgi:hypothetical protein
MGRGRGRQGQRRRRRQRPAHQGFDRLRRMGLRQEEQDVAHPAEEPRRRSFLQPDDDAFKAAAANADWAKTPGFGVVLTDQPGKAAWPITGASYILLHKAQADGVKGKEVLKFFDYAFKNGDAAAADLDYVPMPDTSPSWCRMPGSQSEGRLGQGNLVIDQSGSAAPDFPAMQGRGSGARRLQLLITQHYERTNRDRADPAARPRKKKPATPPAQHHAQPAHPGFLLPQDHAAVRRPRCWQCWSASSSRWRSAPRLRSVNSAWASSPPTSGIRSTTSSAP